MNYHHESLSNGVQFGCEITPSTETVALCVSIKTGARMESEAQQGVAHLLEHMVFKGTDSRTTRKIAEEIDAIGGQMNAYTTMESTVYYIHLLKDSFDTGIDILSDLVKNPVFPEDELAREKDVVLQELAMHHDSPEELVFDQLHDLAWPDQPLGRNILGTEETIQNISRDDLDAFHKQYYCGAQMSVAISGNISYEAAKDAAEKYFGDIPSGKIHEAEGSDLKTGHSHHRKDHLEQTQFMVGYPGLPSGDERSIPLQLFSTLMGGGLSSRLFQQIREEKGLAYTVQSFLTSYRDTGLWGVYAATSPDQIGALRESLQEEISKFLEKGIEDSELARAKQQQISALMMRRESVAGVAEWIARHIQDYGEYRSAHMLADKIRNTTREQVEQVARDLLSAEPPLLTTLGPQG